jgi:hypothetical protein
MKVSCWVYSPAAVQKFQLKRRLGETTASLNIVEKNPLPLPEIKPQLLGHAGEYYRKL